MKTGNDERAASRLGRLRMSSALREVVRETRLHPADLVQPIFVTERAIDAGPIESMPGVERLALGAVADEAASIYASGVRAILLFGIPAAKDETGEIAADPDGIVPDAVRRIKLAVPNLAVITDVCLCQYMTHGHCGLIQFEKIDRDSSLAAFGNVAVAHAQAGADLVAPSAMQDAMVQEIRHALDEQGMTETGIMSYAVKHASAFYGPFRDAASSTPSFGDRKSHQMDPANGREAIAEAAQDIAEGADALIVKPGLSNLDILNAVKSISRGRPVAAYQVSGEYAMIVAAAQRGWLDERGAALESIIAMKRAGADMIVTYWATRAAGWIAEDLP